MPNAAQMLGGNQSLDAKLFAAGQNRVTAPDTKLGEMPPAAPPTPDYSNIRPDMMINPEAGGWTRYQGVAGSFAPPPPGHYRDSEGTIWVRK
jgi:hypothetical protein